MLRSSLLTASTVLLCSTAFGQQQVQAKKANMPLKDAGIYHVGTGTWTRTAGETANLGPDVIYRSDAPSGYFGVGWENAEGVDEGILPGTGNGNFPGTLDDYCINGFQFGYCSVSAGLLDWEFNFYESYSPCDDPDLPANCLSAANGAFSFTGLPANGFCWIVTVDLMGGGEFSMGADGGTCAPGYQGSASGLDHFGWGAVWHTTDGGTTGPLLWGHDVAWVPEGEGTCYNTGFSNPCAGQFSSAAGCQDLFGIGTPFNGCFFFGGYNNTNGCGGPSQGPSAQFAMLLFTDCSSSDCDTGDCFSIYCDPGPASRPNLTDLSIDDCDAGNGRGIFTICDTGGDLDAPQFGYMLQSMTQAAIQDPPGASGTLCVAGGTLCRYNKDPFILPPGGCVDNDLTNPNTGCTAPQATETWNWQAWHRDGMDPSRFSHAITVTYN